MHKTKTLLFVVAPILLWGSVLRAGGGSAPDPNLWLDAPGYDARIEDARAKPARAGDWAAGLVFTSRDYQELLLVPDAGDRAYILDLRSRELAEIPRPEVRLEEDGAHLSRDTRSTIRGTFTVDKGDIRFDDGSLKIALGPKPDLVGEVSLSEILARKPGYQAMAAAYTPDKDAVETLRALKAPVDILVFFGTWCSVCSRRLPLFLKTIQEAGNPNLRARYIAISDDYREPADLIHGNRVRITPTFVVKKDGAEIGRVEKKPKASLEQDLAAIIRTVE
jgi:thioredoxin 1